MQKVSYFALILHQLTFARLSWLGVMDIIKSVLYTSSTYKFFGSHAVQ